MNRFEFDLPGMDQKVGGWAKQSYVDSVQDGVTTKVHFEDSKIIVTKEEDFAPYLKAAQEARANEPMRWGERKWNRAVSIQPSVLAKMIAEGWINDPKALRKWAKENHKLVHMNKYIR